MILRYRLMETAQADAAAGGGEQSSQQQESSAEVEAQAKDMGWQPKEQWKGDQNHWVDAKEFVRRGQTFIPFLQHDRKRLQGELRQMREQYGSVQTQLSETQTQLKEITDFNKAMATERDTRRKSELGSAIRSEEDPVRKAEMETELRTITEREQKRTQQQPPVQQPPAVQQQPQIQPWVQNFLSTNNDFFENRHKTALFNSVILQKRQEGDRRVGEVEGVALLNEVKSEVEKMLNGGNARRQAPAKTEDSRPAGGGGGGSGGSGGKNFFDMPSDAQEKCTAQEARFVGEGKAFKTQAEWRKHYTSEYFGN